MSALTADIPARNDGVPDERVPNDWVRRLARPLRGVINVLFSVALTFLGLTCVTFFIGRIIPIDPVLAIVGDKASQRDL